MLCLETSKYLILGNSISRRSTNGLLLRCIDDVTAHKILKRVNGSTNSNIHIDGHFVVKATSFKILRTRYYFPFIFRDYFKFTKACDKCQKLTGKGQFSTMSLQPILPDFPFVK
jgi:hypothetical protein